jgi:hypothetical protein
MRDVDLAEYQVMAIADFQPAQDPGTGDPILDGDGNQLYYNLGPVYFTNLIQGFYPRFQSIIDQLSAQLDASIVGQHSSRLVSSVDLTGTAETTLLTAIVFTRLDLLSLVISNNAASPITVHVSNAPAAYTSPGAGQESRTFKFTIPANDSREFTWDPAPLSGVINPAGVAAQNWVARLSGTGDVSITAVARRAIF